MASITLAIHRVFPHGGLQRDALRTAQECVARGHRVRLVTQALDGPAPDGIDLCVLSIPGRSNHVRARRFGDRLAALQQSEPTDVVLGFDKLPGLDLYFAGDRCYVERVARTRSPLVRLTPRYRTFSALERAVFGPEAKARILLLTESQRPVFQSAYGTPKERFITLPPGIDRDRCSGPDNGAVRARTRAALAVEEPQFMALLLGSDFRRKGLERVLRAASALPMPLRQRLRIVAVGADDAVPFESLAGALGLQDTLTCFGGRDDVPALLQAADVLVHPAHTEAGGIVLLEALVAGTPTIATDVCGYAEHIQAAGSGEILKGPFDMNEFVHALETVAAVPRQKYAGPGVRYAKAHPEFHRMHARIVDEVERCHAGTGA